MKELLYGMSFLEEGRMIHGDIRPELISVPVHKDDNFRLVDRLSDPSPPINVQFNNFKNQKALYMAPVFFQSFINRKLMIMHNPFKSDIFSLGLVILEAGLLESVQSIYNRQTKDIDRQEMIRLVHQFVDKYPEDIILQEGLMVMLEFGEKMRQTPLEVIQTLKQFRNKQKSRGMLKESTTREQIMNKLRVTESGYELVDAGKFLNQSHFYKFERQSEEGIYSEDSPSQMNESLVHLIRNRDKISNRPPITEQVLEESNEILEDKNSNYEKNIQFSKNEKSSKNENSDIMVGESLEHDLKLFKKQRTQPTVKKQMVNKLKRKMSLNQTPEKTRMRVKKDLLLTNKEDLKRNFEIRKMRGIPSLKIESNTRNGHSQRAKKSKGVQENKYYSSSRRKRKMKVPEDTSKKLSKPSELIARKYTSKGKYQYNNSSEEFQKNKLESNFTYWNDSSLNNSKSQPRSIFVKNKNKLAKKIKEPKKNSNLNNSVDSFKNFRVNNKDYNSTKDKEVPLHYNTNSKTLHKKYFRPNKKESLNPETKYQMNPFKFKKTSNKITIIRNGKAIVRTLYNKQV